MLVEFSIKAARLIVPPVQLGGTRERLAALSSTQHKEEKPANSPRKLRAQSPASHQSPSTVPETQTIELFQPQPGTEM